MSSSIFKSDVIQLGIKPTEAKFVTPYMRLISCSRDSSVVELRVGDGKVAGSWFDSDCQYAVLSLRKTLYPCFLLGPSGLPVTVAQPDKRLANRTQKSALRWFDWTDAD